MPSTSDGVQEGDNAELVYQVAEEMPGTSNWVQEGFQVGLVSHGVEEMLLSGAVVIDTASQCKRCHLVESHHITSNWDWESHRPVHNWPSVIRVCPDEGMPSL